MKILASKVEKILKGSMDLISSPSQTFCIQKFVDNIQPCFAYTPSLPIIWIFTEGEGDGIESRLSS